MLRLTLTALLRLAFALLPRLITWLLLLTLLILLLTVALLGLLR